MDGPMKRDAQSEPERLKVLQLFAVVSIVTAPVYVYTYGKLGSPAGSLAVLAAIPFLMFTFVIWRVTRSTLAAGNWIVAVGYCLLIALAVFTGGIDAPSVTWSLCIPIIATLMCGRLSGAFWLVMTLLEMSALYWLHGKGVLEQQFQPEALTAAYFISVIGVTCFTFLLAFLSELYKARYLRRIEESNRSLEEALSKIKTLKGLLPICAWCKKIRNDQGYWDQIETYFTAHTDAEFSHGICPACEQKQSEEWRKLGP